MTHAIRVDGIGKRYGINRSSAAQTTSIRDQLTNGVRRLFGRPAPESLELAGSALEKAALQEMLDREAELERAALQEAAAKDDAVPFTALERASRIEPRHGQQKEFWALRDISFEVAVGERIAIIGANGAGKSTLLKILSRITAPSEGRIEIRGKVASLLEVGTGFHPELSGRENIFLNGAILGMSRSEIKAKFDQIVAFSGVERFIDTPVKHYSSGMYVRLAFSVSAWLDPDILIIDEVLAVGDTAFQKKCAERIKEMTREGRTVLFVSHSMATVNQTCHKALYLENGRVVSYAPVEEATIEYQRDVIELTEQGPWHRAEFTVPDKNVEIYSERRGLVECLSGWIEKEDGQVASEVPIERPFFIKVRYRVVEALKENIVPNFHLYDELGGRVFISMPVDPVPNVPGEYVAACVIPPFQLNNGRFIAALNMSSFTHTSPVHFSALSALRFEVVEEGYVDVRRHLWNGLLPGVSRPRLDWHVAQSR